MVAFFYFWTSGVEISSELYLCERKTCNSPLRTNIKDVVI